MTVCIFADIFGTELKGLLLSKAMEPSLRSVLTVLSALYPCCLRMNSQLLLEVIQLGLESTQAQLLAHALLNESFNQGCTESL